MNFEEGMEEIAELTFRVREYGLDARYSLQVLYMQHPVYPFGACALILNDRGEEFGALVSLFPAQGDVEKDEVIVRGAHSFWVDTTYKTMVLTPDEEKLTEPAPDIGPDPMEGEFIAVPLRDVIEYAEGVNKLRLIKDSKGDLLI